MATDVIPESAASSSTDAGSKPAAKRLHNRRFLAIYLLLGVAIGAAAVGIVVAFEATTSPSAAWSGWRPSEGGISGARQIAEHVAPSYRLPSGRQLVAVITKTPSVSATSQTGATETIPVPILAVRGPQSAGGDQVLDISSGNAVMFQLCGLGPACAIATGAPSVDRGRLVRREILELALYTFKYIPGIDDVLAFMPPRLGTKPKYVVFFRRGDLSTELRSPLVDTLQAKVPTASTIPATEANAVDAATNPRYYSFALTQEQLGAPILVLTPASV